MLDNGHHHVLHGRETVVHRLHEFLGLVQVILDVFPVALAQVRIVQQRSVCLVKVQPFLETATIAFHLKTTPLFYHLHVRHLDLVRCGRHLLARVRSQPRKTANRLLHLIGGDSHILRYLCIAKRHQVFKMIFQNPNGNRRKTIQGFRLYNKAFLQVPRANALGIKTPEYVKRLYYGELSLFQRYFTTNNLLYLNNERIVVGQDLRHGHLVGTLQKTVLIQRINQVFHQFPEPGF